MNTGEVNEQWQQASEEALSGVAEWRSQHPQAKWREIEQAVDERMARLRSKIMQDTVQHSQRRSWRQEEGAPSPQCPECQVPLQSRGKHRRQVQSSGGTQITIERSYGTCPHCGSGFFPPG